MTTRGALWWRWLAANAVAEAVGLGLVAGGGAVAFAGTAEAGAPGLSVAMAALLVALGAMEGLVVGAAQWVVLRRALAVRARPWIGATMAGAVAAWLLGVIPATVMSATADAGGTPPTIGDALQLALAAVMGAVLGVILAVPQWLVLKRWVRRAGWWIPANSVAWLVGMPVVFAAAGAVPEGARPAEVALRVLASLALAGAAVGAIHGAVLVRLVDVPRLEVPPGGGAIAG
ncbi:MAG: hypothetical protein OER21_06750 [Gemmatimonadota bacterium]|nr:hypothetical protein [Gemmatimonadota bacterium]